MKPTVLDLLADAEGLATALLNQVMKWLVLNTKHLGIH